MSSNAPEFNLVLSMMDFEDGELEHDDMLVLFSHLVRSGMAWTLQGSYGRTAANLVEVGYLSPEGDIL